MKAYIENSLKKVQNNITEINFVQDENIIFNKIIIENIENRPAASKTLLNSL